MESKNIRVIDEHSIERTANVICAFDIDGSEYVTYWIERDAENDNVFVSKLLKNLDGTSNMVNIEDTMEKSKISDTVKELIKYSIDNENDKLPNQTITLPSGKNVLVVPVLINKDQNINVQKTYITTVKKSVTKVSDQYYEIKVEEKEVAPVVTPVVPTEVKPEPVVVPVVEPTPVTPAPETPVVPEVAPAAPAMPMPEVAPIPVVSPEPVLPVIPEVETPKVETPVVEAPKVAEPVVAPILPAEPKAEEVVVAPVPVVETPTLAPQIESTTVVPEVTPATPVVPTPEVAPAPVVTPEPVVTSQPTVVTPVPEPATVAPEAPVESKLVFDASKETNLNQALGEVSNEATIPVENIAPVREFGQDEPVVSNPVPEVAATDISQVGPVLKKKMGFANSKFFMVVAIAFFLASCVFLGYEVFNYFQLKG